ncbi:hypothetical protein [Cellulomonas timonensis]|uniref:hypothetical protein n=1 Tax=Cellulomonas timonensis TaxID=1689271 RepID=UPI00082CEF6D|nr:hypothetical protein [Cellulomonas timonensis]
MRKARAASSPHLAFDVPVAVLELLYVRAALGLDVLDDVPPILSPPAPRPAPVDAEARWRQCYDEMLGQLRQPGALVSPGWLPELLAVPEDVAAGHGWIRDHRELVISGALLANAQNAPLLHRRGESLTSAGVRLALVLPLDGGHRQLVGDGVLMVSLRTLLDDGAWTAAE